MRGFQPDPSTTTTAVKLLKSSAQNSFILQSAKWHKVALFTTSRLCAGCIWIYLCLMLPEYASSELLVSPPGNSVLDQAEREGKRSAHRSSGCQTCYRNVIELCTIASIDTVALSTNSYCHVHVILSIVLQAFIRFTHGTLAEASYSDTTGYTGKLHSLLCMTYMANTEPHLRLLH